MTTRLPLVYVSHAYRNWTLNVARLNRLNRHRLGVYLDRYNVCTQHASLPRLVRTGHEFKLIEVMYDEE